MVKPAIYNRNWAPPRFTNFRKQRYAGRKDETKDEKHGPFCLKSAGSLSRHSKLNALKKQNMPLATRMPPKKVSSYWKLTVQ